MSASKSCLDEFLGRPLFLFPCGFQDRACVVMLVEDFRRVWPIHRQSLIMISTSAGLWLEPCHRSSLLMVIGQRIRKILHRHKLIKVCTFFVVATVVPYLSNIQTNLCIALYVILLYCVVLSCNVFLIHCYVDIIQYNAMHKFVRVLDNPHPCSHIERFSGLSSMNDSARQSLMWRLDDVHNLYWHPIVSEKLPKCISVPTVECFFEIDQIDEQGRVPLRGLFCRSMRLFQCA